VLELATRGDLGGASFGFTVAKNGEQWNGNKRTLTGVNLMEISVVSAWPAYPETTVAARAKGGIFPPYRLDLCRRFLETVR
jgi:HK97 family phage prohead protease